jgi:hypothetical protein
LDGLWITHVYNGDWSEIYLDKRKPCFATIRFVASDSIGEIAIDRAAALGYQGREAYKRLRPKPSPAREGWADFAGAALTFDGQGG